MKEERTICRTPTPGKKPTRIEKWKYDVVRRAILDSLPGSGAGLPFRELSGEVRKKLDAGHLEKLGSVNWYTTTVKLDLEVKGEIRRVEGENPQRLLKG